MDLGDQGRVLMWAYVDALIGALAVLGWFWVVSSRLWHHLMHGERDGEFMQGRLWCGRCAREAADLTRKQWRQEVIEKIERFL
jgi:hypothetical protein